MRLESERLTKLANKNRLTRALKTKLAYGLGALFIPLNMAAGDKGFKGKKTADWVKDNPGTFAKNLAIDTAIGATPAKGPSMVSKIVKGSKVARTASNVAPPPNPPKPKPVVKPPAQPKVKLDRIGPPKTSNQPVKLPRIQ